MDGSPISFPLKNTQLQLQNIPPRVKMIPSTSEAYQVYFKDKSKDHTSPTILQNLILQTVPTPKPGPREVLVRIRAAALNYRDILVIADSPLYLVQSPEGIVPCADGAGDIEAVGKDSKWKDDIGQGVVLVTNRSWLDGTDASVYDVAGTLGAGECPGTLRQYAVVPDELLLRKPKNLSFEEAAALVAAGGTAMNAIESVDIGKESTVLTQGTGGVSCFGIQVCVSCNPSPIVVKSDRSFQFAAALGARVIATSSSDEKLKLAKGLGASDLINYNTTPNWADEVLRLTNGTGVDLVLEVGGAGTIEQSLKALRRGGTAAMIGFLTESHKYDIIPTIVFGAKSCKWSWLGTSMNYCVRTNIVGSERCHRQ